MPGDTRRRWSAVGRRRGGRAPVQQGQRPELGPRGSPADLRALHEQPDPRRARRLAHRAGLALAGQGAQQPQRRGRHVRRLDRLHRSALRPLARLRRRARAGARLPRRLPRRARRRAVAARRRLPEAQRPVLLARREDALDQRHRRRPHPPLLGLLRRLADRRRRHLPDGGLQPGDRASPTARSSTRRATSGSPARAACTSSRATGELLGRILTPENVGNQAWGGEDWKTLFICTSSTVHTLRTTVAGHRTPTMN